MNTTNRDVLDKFKSLLLKKLKPQKMILFGSRARGDAGPYSDMDVVVILDNASDEQDFDYVRLCMGGRF
jgi:predicted nucleotidyltransferase